MRSKRAKKRPLKPDALYKSKVVTRTLHVIMQDGKRTVAQGILYGALEKVSQDRKEATSIFEQAVKNIMPEQEVRSRRVGGATYQVPMPVKHTRAEALAVRWLVEAARKQKGKSMVDLLHTEIMNAHQNQGSAIRKRDETHKMAESNRAFAHFRF